MAAKIPTGIPKKTERIIDAKVSSIVAGNLSKKTFDAGYFPLIEFPKSSLIAFPNHVKYWIRSGASKPKAFRISATSSSVASIGSNKRAGSPGANWIIENVTIESKNSVKTEVIIRPAKRLTIITTHSNMNFNKLSVKIGVIILASGLIYFINYVENIDLVARVMMNVLSLGYFSLQFLSHCLKNKFAGSIMKCISHEELLKLS